MNVSHVIETCPTCGAPITAVCGDEGTHSYEQAESSDLVERFNAMMSVVNGIKETIGSSVLLPNQKLELIASDVQRAVIGIASARMELPTNSKEKKKTTKNSCEDCGKLGKVRYHKKEKMGLFCDVCWAAFPPSKI